MRRTTILLLIVALASPLTALPAATAAEELRLEGTLGGAAYEVIVPDNWNGTLVMYAHGYRDRADAPGQTDDVSASAAPTEEIAEALLAEGYALAGSAYRRNGWAVKEGIIDTKRLARWFRRNVAIPDQVLLTGYSMGSLVTFASIERFPQVYDGALPACAVGAGASRAWDGGLVLDLAYATAFRWPARWGTPGDVSNYLPFGGINEDGSLYGAVFPRLAVRASNPDNFGLFEFVRLVSHLPAEDFLSGSNWLFTDMYFGTEARAEVERRARGPVVQNLDHEYTLTDDEKAYLASLGVDADSLLYEMNATRYEADPEARAYLEANADYTGEITGPVLTLHTTVDGLVPASHEAAYADTVAAAGRSDDLMQVFTESVGHCTFSTEQVVTSVMALDEWVRTGQRPDPVLFDESLGFAPDFQPEPWPFG